MTSPLHILVVEDSADDAQLVLLQLEQDGFRVEYTRVETEEAFIAALDSTPDLILSDYSLPKFNGLRALQITKERGLDIPFILLSGMVGEEIAVEIIKQGAEDYLMKDRLARLGLAVRQALDKKQGRIEKSLADQALRQSEERYRSIFENTTVAIWEEDFSDLKTEVHRLQAEGVSNFSSYITEHPEFVLDALKLIKVTDANEAMVKLYEANTKAEIIGTLDQFVTPEIFQDELIAFAEGKTYFENEVPDQTRQGNHIDLLMTVHYYSDALGNYKALVHMNNITERKRAEENLRNAEIRYRTLIEKIPPIIYISGLQQHIGVNYISPRITSLGYTQEEWVADPDLWFRRVHREDRGRVAADIQKSIRTNEPFKSEYRLVARGGSVRWFLDEAVDIANEAGDPIFRQGFMLDITDRKNAEASLLSREKFLALLNEMTRSILISENYDTIMQTLAFDLTKIIDADDCYIARWNEERQAVVPVASTFRAERPYTSFRAAPSKDLKLALTVMDTRHVIAVDDVYNSPHVIVEFVKQFPTRSALGVPLIAGEHKMGAAVITFNTPHHFTSDEINRAEQAGNQVALALWEFQQSLEIEHRLKESYALTEIGRALSETERIGTDKVLQLIVDSARELIQQAEESVIHIVDMNDQILIPRAISGFDEETKVLERPSLRMGEGVAGEAMRTGTTINVSDIHSSPLFLVTSNIAPTFRSLLVAPVQSGGQQFGTISVQSEQINAFSTRDVELLNAFSVQAGIAIENSRLFETTQQRLREVNALYRTSQGLASSLNTDELIEDVVNLLHENFSYYHAQIYLIDPSSDKLVLKHSSGEIGAKLLAQGFHLARGMGIVGHVAETAIPFATNEVHNVLFFFDNPLLPDTQSELAVPIKVDGAVVGILDVQHKHPYHITDSDLQLMTAVADQLSAALQKAGLYANLQKALEQEQTVRSQLVQSERLALVGRLLASVSHELNNPLQAIQNALFLLKDEEDLSVQGKQDLDVILSEAERMASLIERLRSAYRPVRMKDFLPIELNSLIEDVHTLIATHMRQKEIVFEFLPDTNLPYVSGIPDQIRQVTLNLFLNAIEAMKPGGRLTVQTESRLAESEVFFIVKDTGPGIAPEILPIIFDPFITNKNAGTGLGLTITHDIIEQHHGRIEVENAPEGGAVFKIWLPTHERGRR